MAAGEFKIGEDLGVMHVKQLVHGFQLYDNQITYEEIQTVSIIYNQVLVFDGTELLFLKR